MQQGPQINSPLVGDLFWVFDSLDLVTVKKVAHAGLQLDDSLQEYLDVQLLFDLVLIHLHLLGYYETVTPVDELQKFV